MVALSDEKPFIPCSAGLWISRTCNFDCQYKPVLPREGEGPLPTKSLLKRREDDLTGQLRGAQGASGFVVPKRTLVSRLRRLGLEPPPVALATPGHGDRAESLEPSSVAAGHDVKLRQAKPKTSKQNT